MQYRPAIDGLRALAVVLVLLFHAGVPWVRGGYVGVDVFFVISGYLITSIIQHDLNQHRFTLGRFYERRARRILPAVFLVMAATVAVASLTLLPSDLTRLGPSVIASSAFLSNLYFWRIREHNYLLDETKVEPLLHTWSLAIEEQFYLIFPLVTVLLHRVLRRHLAHAFFTLGLVSFAVSVYLAENYPRSAFYFPLSRAWELLLGATIAAGGIAVSVPDSLKTPLQSVGLLMILWASVTYDTLTRFPGFAALLPCVGAALIVTWSNRESFVLRWLSQPTVVWVGLISYPLYLWHWPLLVLGRQASFRDLRGYEIAVLYALAILLSGLTWRFLEKRFRSPSRIISNRHLIGVAVLGTAALVIAGTVLAKANTWLRLTPEAERLLAVADSYAPLTSKCHNWNRVDVQPLAHCAIGDTGKASFDFALWGDSHAGADALALSAEAKASGRKGLQLTADNCPPLLQTTILIRDAPDCVRLNDAAFALMRQNRLQRAVFAGQWIQYAGGLVDVRLNPADKSSAAKDGVQLFESALTGTIRQLAGAGIDVAIVGPVPEMPWNIPPLLAARTWHGRRWPEPPPFDDFERAQSGVLRVLEGIERQGVTVVYPHRLMCQARCAFESNGEILYRDSEHLSLVGAERLRRMFNYALTHRVRSDGTLADTL